MKHDKIIVELEQKTEDLKEMIEDTKRDIDNFELDNDDYEEQYDQMLNDTYEIKIGYLKFNASDVLKELDPTAYRCGLNDYIDSLDIEDDPKYQELQNTLSELEDELEDLELELRQYEIMEKE